MLPARLPRRQGHSITRAICMSRYHIQIPSMGRKAVACTMHRSARETVTPLFITTTLQLLATSPHPLGGLPRNNDHDEKHPPPCKTQGPRLFTYARHVVKETRTRAITSQPQLDYPSPRPRPCRHFGPRAMDTSAPVTDPFM
jgi:hypothetical protein